MLPNRPLPSPERPDPRGADDRPGAPGAPGGSAPAGDGSARPIRAAAGDPLARSSSGEGPAADETPAPTWGPRRWSHLARVVELAPEEPVLLALSGGADSVYLLHVLAAARPRPRLVAVHVDHALRGAESAGDADFCRALAARLDVPLSVVAAPVEPGPDLEARARSARYQALAEEARRLGFATVATGHHADDALETTVLRWLRGTHLGGLGGMRRRALVPHVGGAPAGKDAPLTLVRPLIAMRREEVRDLLRRAGRPWREDSSNASRAFTRNRVRHDLLPALGDLCPDAIENLRSFGRAVESLEDAFAAATAHLHWDAPSYAHAVRSRGDAHLGGTLPRAELAGLPPPLRRRALWRLVLEGTGRAPGRRLLERLVEDVASGRRVRHALPAGFDLHLRAARLVLTPPRRTPDPAPTAAAPADDGEYLGELRPGGRIVLPDGRVLRAELREDEHDAPVPREAHRVELDAESLDGPLRVRWPRPGDRFRGLGSPGSKPLGRFLADAGVAREDRGRVPLVVSGDELLWVGGIRPSHRARVRPSTRRRLRLVLEGVPA